MAETTLPAQQFVEIQEIRDGVLYLKRGGLRRILIVSGVNFDLKSESEQNLILNSFQNFLNTLDFGVQFFVHSRKVNIDAYLEKMRGRSQAEQNELLKIQIDEYVSFIKSFVEQNAIIAKSFFLVIPYEPIALSGEVSGIFSLFKKTPKKAEQEKTTSDNNLEQLSHRVDQVISGLEQIGLRATTLNDEELIELFYNLYNPQLIEKKGLEIAKEK
ncbi:MAG: hypothetical protein UY23_C0001G0183 [Candidatus Jorgensenbacteria bacterium GW2011_GWA1_48_11]|uniref:TraC-like domain-containing protein n=1 Tax=Candidatus Jorgensenbacteria bacterium GW2011_GWA1_48_11 TaxID=1618660 RepID=A0A0G1UBS0_9BACT|nr:MAG: hypothetical protein UY23_C0001G0183 [Candidatus Jorgensenbacteria bacterium GW2011_GWA1_48_11]KKW12070.1 MAG: hypothetical protein UY51_C0005G0312 [Candidatus Jorgensenbacteria bacterium GW2011_GWB1_49_9]